MKLDALYALLRRRGVLWPTAETYGGVAGLYDYGPIGTALKRRLEDAWESWFLGLSDDYYRIEPAEILPEPVVRASGHLENFTDPEVLCGQCHSAFRADTVLEKFRPEGLDGMTSVAIGALVAEHHVRCPNCGATSLTVPPPFNLMFGLDLGVTGKERGYLRPETAQSSYLAFPRMWDVGRRALPLGIAIVGKAYRNEIAPRQVLFRLRSFTQAELQIFFAEGQFSVPFESVAREMLPVVRTDRRGTGEAPGVPTSAADLVAGGLPEFYVYHLVQLYRFLRDVLGHPAESVRFWEKSSTERAFYNRLQFDAEVRSGSLGGFREVGAVHYRGDYDLTRHGEGAKRDPAVATAQGARIVPHVLEITIGVDRLLWGVADALLVEENERTVWKLPTYLAPVSVGVFPLLKKEHGAEARRIHRALLADGIRAEFDDAGSIGKRYARMDEVGAPYCVTVDGPTLDPASPDHGTVTLRERDSKIQRRVAVAALSAELAGGVRPPRPAP